MSSITLAPGSQAQPDARRQEIEKERTARRSTADYIRRNLGEAALCSDREEVLDVAIAAMPAAGLVCEFGVFEGQTITYIASRMPERTIFGFDSFEGLPEDWRGPFSSGVFSRGGQLPVVPFNVHLVKGWFDEVLPGFAAAHLGPAALLHVDCDLYSSTQCIFRKLGDRIGPGTVIVFDEYFDYPGWEEHEHRAFAEFVGASGLGYRYIAYNRLHEQVAVLITERRRQA